MYTSDSDIFFIIIDDIIFLFKKSLQKDRVWVTCYHHGGIMIAERYKQKLIIIKKGR